MSYFINFVSKVRNVGGTGNTENIQHTPAGQLSHSLNLKLFVLYFINAKIHKRDANTKKQFFDKNPSSKGKNTERHNLIRGQIIVVFS